MKLKKSEFECGGCGNVFKLKDAVTVPSDWMYEKEDDAEVFVCIRCGLEETICYVLQEEKKK